MVLGETRCLGLGRGYSSTRTSSFIIIIIFAVEEASLQQQEVAAGSGHCSNAGRRSQQRGLSVSAPASSLLQGCSDDGITLSFCTIARAPHAQVVASMPARFWGMPTSQLHGANRTAVRGVHAWVVVDSLLTSLWWLFCNKVTCCSDESRRTLRGQATTLRCDTTVTACSTDPMISKLTKDIEVSTHQSCRNLASVGS